MAFSQFVAPVSNASDADWRAWGAIIDDFLLNTLGWTQSSDTGQAVLTQTTFDLDSVAGSGGDGIYTYSNLAGPALVVGMSVVISGCTNAGNDGTFTITALGSGTFTVVNAGAVNESPSPGAGETTPTSRPGNNSYVYKIYQPADALTTFYLKIEYGSGATAANNPRTRWSAATGTDGAGTLNGFTTLSSGNASGLAAQTNTPNAPNAMWFMSGTSSRFTMGLLFSFSAGISATNNWFVNVERLHDSDGAENNDGFCVLFCNASTVGISDCWTVVFGTGSKRFDGASNNAASRQPHLLPLLNAGQNEVLGLKVPCSPLYPQAGQFLYPLTGLIFTQTLDLQSTSWVELETQLYGVDITYIANIMDANQQTNSTRIGLRWD